MTFFELMQAVRKDPLDVTVPARWAQGRASFGGLVAALAYGAMRDKAQPGRPVRSLAITFVGPMEAEVPARFEAEVRAVADTGADQGQELALLALAAGGLALARAVPDQALSNRILESCRDAAVRLAKSYEGDPT